MFKALINSVILFFLLLINMGLFTWCINYLMGQAPLKKTFINNVQAEAKLHTPHPVQRLDFAQPVQKLVPGRSISPLSSSRFPEQTRQQVVLQFQSTQIELDKSERVKLQNQLQRLNIQTDHRVQVFFGPVLSEKNIQSPQVAKLRALMVARMIYPYTQTVTMYYRPSFKPGKLIVDFYSSPLSE